MKSPAVPSKGRTAMVDSAWGDDMSDLDRPDDSMAYWSGKLNAADARIAELEAENARLTKERDESGRRWRDSFDAMHQRAMRAEAKHVVDLRHFNILVEAMAEVKATSDGLSDQPVADIVQGCIDEIASLEPAPETEEPFDAEMRDIEASINSGARRSSHRFSLSPPTGKDAVQTVTVERLIEQAAHLELGLACRRPDVTDATKELLRLLQLALPALAAVLQQKETDR
ncbi:hypothetical protein [Mesorhizobium sp. CAU 1741]|uniref:hypothetical protein n=1 Tax=Mesorhizobium sp. CAU 1741 TaxID=3140366 RepID=UPI00325B8F6B